MVGYSLLRDLVVQHDKSYHTEGELFLTAVLSYSGDKTLGHN